MSDHTRVFVVTVGDYDENHIERVFFTESEAEEWAARRRTISEYEPVYVETHSVGEHQPYDGPFWDAHWSASGLLFGDEKRFPDRVREDWDITQEWWQELRMPPAAAVVRDDRRRECPLLFARVQGIDRDAVTRLLEETVSDIKEHWGGTHRNQWWHNLVARGQEHEAEMQALRS